MTEQSTEAKREPHINPRPRTRDHSAFASAAAEPLAQPPPTRPIPSSPAPTATPSARDDPPATRDKNSAPRSYDIGYGKPPVKSRFKEGGPPGPGRPRGRKSQDTLRREALNTKRTVRVGGRSRKVTNLELMNTLLVNDAIEKRNLKQITDILADARRLYPEQDAGPAAQDTYDPAADRAALAEFMTLFTLGEPDPDAADPLGDLALDGLDLGDRTDAGGEGDWDATAETSGGND